MDLNLALVYKFRKLLPNLAQKQYGTISVANYEKIITPVIWASFITGKEKHDVKTFTSWGYMDKIAQMLHLRGKGLGRILRLLGLKPRPSRTRHETMFDIIKPSIAISVPSYNFWREQFELDLEIPIIKAIGNKELTETKL